MEKEKRSEDEEPEEKERGEDQNLRLDGSSPRSFSSDLRHSNGSGAFESEDVAVESTQTPDAPSPWPSPTEYAGEGTRKCVVIVVGLRAGGRAEGVEHVALDLQLDLRRRGAELAVDLGADGVHLRVAHLAIPRHRLGAFQDADGLVVGLG